MTELIKQRGKYYLALYLLSFPIITLTAGVETILDLFPIKIVPLFISIYMGNLCHYAIKEKMSPAESTLKSMKLILYFLVFMPLFLATESFISRNYGISINFLLGMK